MMDCGTVIPRPAICSVQPFDALSVAVNAHALTEERTLMSINDREFGDLKNEIFRSGAAAAAIGACVAGHLLKSDPSRQEALISQALSFASGFEARGQAHASSLMRLFARGVAKPEIFSRPNPSDEDDLLTGSHDATT